MATRRATSRVQTHAVSRYGYGSRVIATPAPVRTAATTSSRSDPAYVAAQLRNVMESRDHQALTDLQNGKLIPFITYAEERVTHPVDDADAARWQKLLQDAKDKAEEEAVSAGVASGDIPLEAAQKFLTDRRGKYEPSDPRFADLTQQIADVKNAIAARDFNAELNTALSDMVQSGNTIAAKEKYLQKLIAVLPRAKDPKAISTIQSQMLDLAKAIQTDKINARSTETSAKLVAYYNGQISGGEIQDYLQQMAQTALSADEAKAYATAASQVATRERTLQTQAVRAAASGSSAAAVTRAVSNALAPLTNATKDASANFSNSLKRSGVPDVTSFNVMKQAAQTELDAIEQAIPQSSTAAANVLIARRDALLSDMETRQRAAATKTLQTQRDQQSAFTDSIDTLRKQGAPYEETAQMAARRVAAIHDARAVPWMSGYEQDPTLGGDLTNMERDTRKILTDEAATSTGVLTGTTKTTDALSKEYQRYAGYFVKKGTPVPMGQDEWLRVMTQENDAKRVSELTQLPTDATSVADMRMEMSNIRDLWNQRHNEVQTAADKLIAASWPRDANGQRLVYGAAIEGQNPTKGPGGRPSFFDPTRGGLFDASVFAPLVAGHQRGGAQQDYATGDMTTGAGVAGDQGATGAGAPPDPNEMPDAQRRARLAAMDPHDAADAVLSQQTDFTYPTWEIPALPDWGAFSSGPQLTAGYEDQYLPPSLPAYQPPTFALPAVAGPGPAFDPGFTEAPSTSYAPPPPPTGGGGNAMLTP